LLIKQEQYDRKQERPLLSAGEKTCQTSYPKKLAYAKYSNNRGGEK